MLWRCAENLLLQMTPQKEATGVRSGDLGAIHSNHTFVKEFLETLNSDEMVGLSILLSLEVNLHLWHNLLIDRLKIGLIIEILFKEKWTSDHIIATQSDPDSHSEKFCFKIAVYAVSSLVHDSFFYLIN